MKRPTRAWKSECVHHTADVDQMSFWNRLVLRACHRYLLRLGNDHGHRPCCGRACCSNSWQCFAPNLAVADIADVRLWCLKIKRIGLVRDAPVGVLLLGGVVALEAERRGVQGVLPVALHAYFRHTTTAGFDHRVSAAEDPATCRLQRVVVHVTPHAVQSS